MQYARSVIDPWGDQHCVPDAALRTGCATYKSIYLINTGAGGTANVACCPSLDDNSYQGLPTGASFSFPTTALWSNTSVQATYSGLYSSYRPISMGIKLNYVGPTNSDQGNVIVGFYGKEQALSDLNATDITLVSKLNDFSIMPLKSCIGKEITWRPEDESDATDFIDITSNNPGTTDLLTSTAVPYSSIVVGVLGAVASTTVLNLEVITTWQFKIKNSITGVGAQSMGPAEPGWYEKAANVFSKVSRLSTYVPWQEGSSIARQIAQSAAPVMLNSLMRRNTPLMLT